MGNVFQADPSRQPRERLTDQQSQEPGETAYQVPAKAAYLPRTRYSDGEALILIEVDGLSGFSCMTFTY
jgi:hypothetical protein